MYIPPPGESEVKPTKFEKNLAGTSNPPDQHRRQQET